MVLPHPTGGTDPQPPLPGKIKSPTIGWSFHQRSLQFNLTPLAPPVTKVLIFEGPGDWRTFAQNGVEGWYLGTDPSYYQLYTMYAPKTHYKQVAKTINPPPTWLSLTGSFLHWCHPPLNWGSDWGGKKPSPLSPFILGTRNYGQYEPFKKSWYDIYHKTLLKPPP